MIGRRGHSDPDTVEMTGGEVRMGFSPGRRCSVLTPSEVDFKQREWPDSGCPMVREAPFQKDTTVHNVCAPNSDIKLHRAKMDGTGKRGRLAHHPK